MLLPLSPLRNRDFLSNHWLEHRLPLEPEWREHQPAAHDGLQRLLSLWRVERARVALYGDEAGLEEKFIQPVFECLGWHLKYQSYLDRREPDYALFLSDANQPSEDTHRTRKCVEIFAVGIAHASIIPRRKPDLTLPRPGKGTALTLFCPQVSR